MVSQELLDILVCPACKTKVLLEADLLVCSSCGRRYPVRDGFPIMLISEGDRLRVQPPSPAQS
jgi:uncharacterized protein YbaR (Trm112 family)